MRRCTHADVILAEPEPLKLATFFSFNHLRNSWCTVDAPSICLSCDLMYGETWPSQSNHHAPRKIVYLQVLPLLTMALHSIVLHASSGKRTKFLRRFLISNCTNIANFVIPFPYISLHVCWRVVHLTLFEKLCELRLPWNLHTILATLFWCCIFKGTWCMLRVICKYTHILHSWVPELILQRHTLVAKGFRWWKFD